MKKVSLALVLTCVFVITMVIGSVNVFAASDPYTAKIGFVDYVSVDETGTNEFHADKLKKETGSYELGNMGGTYPGAWLEYASYSFGTNGSTKIKIDYCNNSARCATDAKIEVWIDGHTTSTGTKVGTVDLPSTGDNWGTYSTAEGTLTKITGDHTVYFVLAGTNSSATPFISNIGAFQFVEEAASGNEGNETATPTPAATQNNNSGNDNEDEGKDVPKTGDAGVVIALCATAVAALGGLKLRKK